MLTKGEYSRTTLCTPNFRILRAH